MREMLSLVHRPGFAIALQLITSLSHQVEASIRPVDMQFLSRDQLSFQSRFDLCGDTRFRCIGRREAHYTDQTAVQDALAHVASRRLPSFFVDQRPPLDLAGLPVRVRFNILRDDRLEQSSKTAERDLPLAEAESGPMCPPRPAPVK